MDGCWCVGCAMVRWNGSDHCVWACCRFGCDDVGVGTSGGGVGAGMYMSVGVSKSAGVERERGGMV